MALYDNKYWLLSHIRNSFISTDDTGMCEMIMAGEEGVRRHLKETLDMYPDEEDSEDDDTLSHESYDLQPDMDFGMRYRSNTAARLEKLEMMKRKSSHIKNVKWEVSKTPLSKEALDEFFVKVEPRRKDPEKKSTFSETFKQYTKLPSNPFIKYAKFDGSGQVKMPTKKYRIFLTMLPEQQRNYPMSICCIGSAKIQELIGLILLKCSTHYETHKWKPPTNYGLYITEEDGEVDRDFPCLDPIENISKFGFACLGLVEHNDPSKCVSFETTDSYMPDTTFESIRDGKIREQSRIDQEKQIQSDLQLMEVHHKSMEAPLYKSYLILMVTKMRSKVEVNVGISGEQIEIDPLQSSSKFSLVKQKPINHKIDSIALCEVIEIRSSRTVFRLVYSPESSSVEHNNAFSSAHSPISRSPTNFKSYEFEADHSTAEEIVHKICLILELRTNDVRREYLSHLERKHSKRKFQFK